MFDGIEPRGIRVRRVVEPEFQGLLVHPLHEGVGALRGRTRERAGGRVVGRDERQVQEIVERHLVVRAQIRVAGTEDVAPVDRHDTREIRVTLEEHGRRHHLGDAGNRPLVLRVLLPEHLAVVRVVDDGGRGANIRNHRPLVVQLVPGLLRFEPLGARAGGFGP